MQIRTVLFASTRYWTDPAELLRAAEPMTVQGCTAAAGRYEPNCRTQLCVRSDDRQKYLDTLLGCHQVLVFGDMAEDVLALAEILEIEVF